jgi:uncharacterized protein YbgA (DUF1722 family)
MKEYPLLPVEEEGRLNDPKIRENFIVRVFAYARLQRDLIRNFSRGRLVAFHTATKLLIMAHSPKHYSEMGQLVAHAKAFNSTELKTSYTQLFMEAFKLRATTKKNYNVLQHIFGFFSDRLSGDEKEDILGCLKDYKDELVPLIVPVTLLKHYVQKFSVDYILGQTYLNPSPKELMLRNHV